MDVWRPIIESAYGRAPSRFQEGISIDKNFKFDAVQQLRAIAYFNCSLFHFCHTLVNSSSRSREQTEEIL
jgi:hypothetical protein